MISLSQKMFMNDDFVGCDYDGNNDEDISHDDDESNDNDFVDHYANWSLLLVVVMVVVKMLTMDIRHNLTKKTIGFQYTSKEPNKFDVGNDNEC